jgi:hypothetical protein
VVARYEAEPAAAEGWPAEHQHLDSAAPKRARERPWRAPRSHPVVNQPHRNAAPRGGDQLVRDGDADLVGPEDVTLERDRGPRLANELEHDVEERPVTQEADAVPAGDARAPDAEQLVHEGLALRRRRGRGANQRGHVTLPAGQTSPRSGRWSGGLRSRVIPFAIIGLAPGLRAPESQRES